MKFIFRVLPVLMVALAGCGGKSPVTGKVVFSDGTPAPLVTIIFEAEDGLTSAVGKADAEGSYQLSYESANDGVPPGRYHVAITPPHGMTLTDEDRKLSPGPGWGIKSKYRSPSTSELTFEVEPGRNEFTIKLEGPAGKGSAGEESEENVLQKMADQDDSGADVYKDGASE